MDKQRLRIWWITNMPMDPFLVEVDTVEQGVHLLEALAAYDLFQLEHNVRDHISNTGGLEMYETENGFGWVDWHDPLSEFDDPSEYLMAKGREEA